MEKMDKKLDVDFGKTEEIEDTGQKPDINTFEELAKTRSFSLTPLKGKAPIEKGWTKCCRKQRPFKKSHFKGRNAGVCCGPASGLIVLDVDDQKLLVTLMLSLGLKLRKTFRVKTGSGGLHYYYRYPEEGDWGNKSLKLSLIHI